ncbi:MAG: C40 family peptidase [Candidatus Eremiobacteraeota bacterium]|nr:C40 family peptidase [Candidatus Eremiobacteraeota bacterium]MBV8582480.1 C40 family peptidase [Candidatus Eremiobacteraeota bacterium]
MRQALAAGAFALLIATSSAIAKADPVSPSADYYESAATQSVNAQTVSPDVAVWTSHLVISAPRRERGGFGRFAGGILARTSKIAQQLTRSALRFLGTPYVFGGDSPSGFDCSAYVQHVFGMVGISLPRTADAQYDVGSAAVGGPQPGDLVFFQTYTYGPSHVGIYLGNGEFVHASSSHGVMVSKLSESYWASRYLGAKRLIASKR